MTELSWPALTVLLGIPFLAALAPKSLLTPRGARRLVLGASFLDLLVASAIAVEFHWGRESAASLVDRLDPGLAVGGRPLFFVDELNSLLLPFGALLFAFTVLMAPRTERARASARRFLAAEGVVLGTFATREPALLAFFWAMSTLNLYLELRSELATRPTARAVGLYMAASVLLFAIGVGFAARLPAHAGVNLLLLIAVLIRKGIVPFHSWFPTLYERVPLSAATLFSGPQLAAYATARLIVPNAGSQILSIIGLASFATAFYGAALSLAAKDVRRALGMFVMSQSALVMAGLDSGSSIGLAGGLSLWISSSLALAGLTMILAALEARRGSLSLNRWEGSYRSTPLLAISFLVFGLTAVGFPGTLGFIGEEALAHGAFEDAPHRGALVLLASALNGINVLRFYFALFGGPPPLRARARWIERTRPRERISVLVLSSLLLAGGLFPRSFLESRVRAARQLLSTRHSPVTDRPEPRLKRFANSL
jgi:NADH-quinone oxidoreductase subunit M